MVYDFAFLKHFFTLVVITLSRSQSLSRKSAKTVFKGAQTRETNTKDRDDSWARLKIAVAKLHVGLIQGAGATVMEVTNQFQNNSICLFISHGVVTRTLWHALYISVRREKETNGYRV